MTWTRHWGIISSIAVVQLGILVGYQALLTGGPSAASAGQVPPPKASEVPTPTVPITPPIKLPAMIESAQPLPPAPDFSGPQLVGPGQIVPVGAKEDPLLQVVQPVPPPGVGIPSEYIALPAPAAKAPGSPWNVALEIVDGRTRLTAQNGKDVKFTVSCDKLDMQTPRGRIEASGKVKVVSDNLEGTCERLTISWQDDVVVLEKVQLKCKLEGQAAELNAEQLRLRLNRMVSNAAASDWLGWSAGAK
jgi:hypothetical protein